jgi:hypothetical protein
VYSSLVIYHRNRDTGALTFRQSIPRNRKQC